MSTKKQHLGLATKDQVLVRGSDLCEDLIGHITFTDLVYRELMPRLPSDAERAVLDAVLVALTEHGLTPTAVVARMTEFGAPGALQGAVAAGLLGAGDRFLGAVDGAARILQEWPADVDDAAHAEALVVEARSNRAKIPGLGHPTHVDGDPRTVRLYAVATENGLTSTARDRLELVKVAAERASGRSLPINVDGAAGALLTDIGIPWQVGRGIALVARTAGLVGHLWDEIQYPTGPQMWAAAEEATPYEAPEAQQ